MRTATRLPNDPRRLSIDQAALDHAYRLIHRVCCLAGSGDFVETVRNDNKSLRSAIERHDTPALFDWLMAMLSYQGISDSVAYQYMEDHGRITWADVEASLKSSPSCPKLNGYWLFHGCRYHKTSTTCAEPDHIGQCPLANLSTA